MEFQDKFVQQELEGLIGRYAGAAKRVAMAYASRRTRERDINFLALQATKEYGAMVYHSGAMWRKAKALDSIKNIRKSSQDSYEESEHFLGYMIILDWCLNGEPCSVPEMWGYGDISDAFGAGPGMKESLWPEHYRYFAMGEQLAREAHSDWMRQVILTNREGAAVGFHYVMGQLPVTDEFMKRLTEHERSVAEDELHHGSEMIPELVRTFASLDELAVAKRHVTDIHIQELRQRNEQFLHPLTPAEMQQLEDDFRQDRIEPIPFYTVASGN
ncbi:MAG: hypothetical protein HY316_08550 [Acidobacteria bacterium]|nr:hypothetical protein [Acidobacteriota bacterium]